MSKNGLFSVILLHYNQPQYVKTALDSVFAQNYPQIELIFADDCSAMIDVDDLKSYCESKRTDNIKDIIWQINPENMGTVKSLNSAVAKASGEYLLFFAADDALYDADVLKNYADAFKHADDDVYMISSQCHMMDESLQNRLSLFVSNSAGERFNKMTAKEQFKVFAEDCFLAIGATATRTAAFERFGTFSEKYKLVEDWYYYIKVTREGGRIKYVNFNGLLHRSGGVSHSNPEDGLKPHVVAFIYDMVKIRENEVLPYLGDFTNKEKTVIINKYIEQLKAYRNTGDGKKTLCFFKRVKYFGAVSYGAYLAKRYVIYISAHRLFLPQLILDMLFLWGFAAAAENIPLFGGCGGFFKAAVRFICPAAVIAAFCLPRLRRFCLPR